MGIAYEGGVGVPTIPGQNGVQHTGAVAPLTLHVAQESEYSEPTAPIALRLQPEPAPSPEVEIGNIMIQLQRFTDETAAEAERKAQEVIAGAEAQAAVLIQRASEANGQAQASVPPVSMVLIAGWLLNSMPMFTALVITEIPLR